MRRRGKAAIGTVTSHWTLPYTSIACRHVEGQKCTVVIERKAPIGLLLTNASDYSSETTIFVRYKHIDLSMQVLLEYDCCWHTTMTLTTWLIQWTTCKRNSLHVHNQTHNPVMHAQGNVNHTHLTDYNVGVLVWQVLVWREWSVQNHL